MGDTPIFKIFLYLSQFNLDLYETWNLNFIGTNQSLHVAYNRLPTPNVYGGYTNFQDLPISLLIQINIFMKLDT